MKLLVFLLSLDADRDLCSQVTGELSNNGQPMRRFMQTFVLAPQSPKKYYVHNDIFRYQDEVFHDNDNETEVQDETVGESPRATAEAGADVIPHDRLSHSCQLLRKNRSCSGFENK